MKHKGSARKKCRKYAKGNTPVKNKKGGPRKNISSKVAKTLLEVGKNHQSSLSCQDIKSISDGRLTIKRKYSYLKSQQEKVDVDLRSMAKNPVRNCQGGR